jgi:single-stranded DNA-binding protein
VNSIEAAFTAKVMSDPENKISAAGNPWMRFSVAIGEGESVQYAQVAVFGDQAAKIAGQITKGSKVYCEGKIRLDRWEKEGEKRAGLSLAAWRCDLIGQIGKSKPPRETMGSAPITASSFAGPTQRTKPGDQGRDNFEFNDEIPFGR